MLHIYTPENVEEPLVFWYFKGVAEIQHWPEMGYWSTDKWNIPQMLNERLSLSNPDS